ncbi:retroviral-like aspartic protease family protein [Qipengyuania qiaonensis]|uniref:Aspartyl protease family protein n=1 Tax=Qipengyuania qiaonensis TaxID=2867240 RepID=A0ABS7J856_9SPHN|nr:retroviral-like aspartic protease family protein [Qipengyuania qiaonensis]MBX7483506.1 aspartyl protease family protein [Qipengyuania qiaonensis]
MFRGTALAALLCLATGSLSATAPEAESPSAEEAALASDRYERMTVPVTIGDSGSYRFLIDTGAQATVVTHRIVDKLGLTRRGQARLVAMGSSQMVDLVEVDELRFADRLITGLMSPLLHAGHIGADGILGLDSLQDLRVLIDFRRERMLVADADILGGNSGYEIIVRARRKLGQMVITDAEVDGIRVAVVIDSGAQNSIGNRALLRKLKTRDTGLLTSIDVHGAEVLSDLSYVRELEIGGMTMGNVPIGFTDSPIFQALGLDRRPALILGIGNMRVFDRVAIDFRTRQVLFDVPGQVDASRARAMFTTGGPKLR